MMSLLRSAALVLLTAAFASAHMYSETVEDNAFAPGGNCSETNPCQGRHFCMHGKCLPCKPGQFSALFRCLDCPFGTFLFSNESSCRVCPVGTWSLGGAMGCRDCPQSTFAPEDGSVTCLDCPAGTWSPRASASCTPCPAGTYSLGFLRVDRGKGCEPCASGTFSRDGASSCDSCPEGKFSTEGQSACSDEAEPLRPLTVTHVRLIPVGMPMWQIFMLALTNVWFSIIVLAGFCLYRNWIITNRFAVATVPDEIGEIRQSPGGGDVGSKV